MSDIENALDSMLETGSKIVDKTSKIGSKIASEASDEISNVASDIAKTTKNIHNKINNLFSDSEKIPLTCDEIRIQAVSDMKSSDKAEFIDATIGKSDITVIVLLFCFCLGMGFYGLYSEKKSKKNKPDQTEMTEEEVKNYLLGGRKMTAIPVGLSLAVSFMSAITILGVPAESYMYGHMYIYMPCCFFLIATTTSFIYLPVFYNSGIVSAYEYLELRFSPILRVFVNIMFSIQTLLYTGICIYAPSIALEKATGMSLANSIFLTCTICVIYTAIGGLKAVIFNDVMQAIIIWIGFIAVIWLTLDLMDKSLFEVFEIVKNDQRWYHTDWEMNPQVRHSMWSIFIGGWCLWSYLFSVNQSVVSRQLSCKTLGQARGSCYVSAAGCLAIIGLAMTAGFVMYVYFRGCDPLQAHTVAKSDQLIVQMVLEVTNQKGTPLIAGIYLAGAYSATLSTVAASVNALSCTTLEDIVKVYFPPMAQTTYLLIAKLLVVFFGGLCLGLAFLVGSIGDSVLMIALNMIGNIGGPILAIFTLGMVTRFVNHYGAIIGLILGEISGFTFMILTNLPLKKSENDACMTRRFTKDMTPACENLAWCNQNQTDRWDSGNILSENMLGEENWSDTCVKANSWSFGMQILQISYTYYSTVQLIITCIIAIVVSFLTRNKTRDVEDRLLIPAIRNGYK